MKVSIIIRTLDEAAYLPELLSGIRAQVFDGDIETVIVDSGSSDDTLAIAKAHEARITFIEKEDFSFGRSLNIGCAFATGEILVFVSGHCVPCDTHWLSKLVAALTPEENGYVYGRQIGRDTTQFSERQIFMKYFPDHANGHNADFFCNNANAAIRREIWEKYRFDEGVTGLEDMELARRYVNDGGHIGYVHEAGVFHIHNESFLQTRSRYEREALALQKIAPELYLSLSEALRFYVASVLHDGGAALEEKCFVANFVSIIRFRFAQYWGSYRGSKRMRLLSRETKMNYFYPKG